MKLSIREIAVFSMLGALMYTSKILMDALPNIHLLDVFIVAFTVVFRKKALYPIYVFVFLCQFVNGFSPWLASYYYIWAIPWAVVMLLPQHMPTKIAVPVYMLVCALHGFLFGTLCAPVQALLFGLDWKGMLAWIAAGIPFDVLHGISNFFCGALVLPIVTGLKRARKSIPAQ